MTRYDRPDVPFFLDEVIGSFFSYHQPTCHIIQFIKTRNYKRLRDHKEAQYLGLNPCPTCRPAFDPSLVRDTEPVALEPAAEPLKSDIPQGVLVTPTLLGDMRRGIVRLLDLIDTGVNRQPDETVGGRISRLAWQKLIPRQVAASMKVITEMRNVVEYQAKVLSPSETNLVASSQSVIREWALENGIPLPSELTS